MKYVILTYNICNTGGAQLYVARRAKWLKSQGYDVVIITSYDNGNFVLQSLFSDFETHNYEELDYSPGFYSYSKVEYILKAIINTISCKDCIIESHTLELVVWGELLAQKMNAKHIAYILAEPKISQYRFILDKKVFYKKYENDEFYGVSSMSLDKIFEKRCKRNFVNIGFDESELAEKSIPSISYSTCDEVYTIGTITRLDKTYVEPLIVAACDLAKKYPNQKFHLIVAGGSKTEGREDYLFSKYATNKLGIENFSITFLGYISTLGKDLFQSLNVFVGMGTASINSISQKCLTLNIQPFDDLCSGFFGVDTANFAYTENGKLYSIVDKMEEAYLLSISKREEYIKIARKLYESEFETEACFRKLDNVVYNLRVVSHYPIMRNRILHDSFCYVFRFVRLLKQILLGLSR